MKCSVVKTVLSFDLLLNVTMFLFFNYFLVDDLTVQTLLWLVCIAIK